MAYFIFLVPERVDDVRAPSLTSFIMISNQCFTASGSTSHPQKFQRDKEDIFRKRYFNPF
jgi:hypothetical protein